MTSVREGMLNGNPPAYCRRCPANLFVFKEKYRAEYAPHLREAYTKDTWARLSLPERAAYMAAKGARSVREVGVGGTVSRTKRWLKLITEGQRS